MMIRTYSEMITGTRMSVELKHGESVVGTVRWVQDGNVGLMFDQPIDVPRLLESTLAGPRPRMPRVEIGVSVLLREDVATHRCEALDISQGGLKVRSAKPLVLCRPVVVTLPGLQPTPAMTRWVDGDCYGISFNQVLPLQMLIRWLKEQHRPRFLAAS